MQVGRAQVVQGIGLNTENAQTIIDEYCLFLYMNIIDAKLAMGYMYILTHICINCNSQQS